MHEKITPKIVTVNPLYEWPRTSLTLPPYIIPKAKMQHKNNALPTYSSHVSENLLSFKKNKTGTLYKTAGTIANLLK